MFNKLAKHTNGSVSVYLMVILLPLFLFQALFADMIRLRLATGQSELALKAGLRSALSYYSNALADYGLYGMKLSVEDTESSVYQAMMPSLRSPALGAWPYSEPELDPDGLEVKMVYTLANPAVFERQLGEEMKLKAPVEFLTEVVDKLKKTGADAAMKRGTDYYAESEQLERLYWERERALDAAQASSDALISAGLAGTRAAEDALIKLQELSERIGLHSLEEAKQGLQDTQASLKKLSEDAAGLAKSLQTVEADISALPKTVMDAAERLQALQSEAAALQASIEQVHASITELGKKKDEWESLLQDMAAYTSLYVASKAAVQASAAGLQTLSQSAEKQLQQARAAETKWRQAWAELPDATATTSPGQGSANPYAASYPDSFYDEYATGLASLAAGANALSLRWSETEWWTSSSWGTLQADADAIEQRTNRFSSDRQAEEVKRAARNRQLKGETDQQKNSVKSALGAAKAVLQACPQDTGADQDAYRQLEGAGGLASKYRSYQHLPEGVSSSGGLTEDADAAIGGGMSLLKQLSEAGGTLRDDLLLNEYVLSKFNYRTWSAEAAQSPDMAGRSHPESHALQNQETEYALYGFSSCEANTGAAYAEMYLFLLAIRTVEAWMEPGVQAMQAGTPLLAMLAAAAKGAVQALQDMRTLTSGEPIALFQRFQAFKLTYKDALRLMLLLHPNHNSVLARTQALVELNTGVDLKTATTYIQGFSSVRLKLWFIPGLLRMLGRQDEPGLRVENGRVVIRRMAVASYD